MCSGMSAPGKSTACGNGKIGSSRMAGRRSRANDAGGGFPDGGGGGVVATGLRCRCLRRGVTAKKLTTNQRKTTAMRSHRKELWFETTTRRAYLNITPLVEAEVA